MKKIILITIILIFTIFSFSEEKYYKKFTKIEKAPDCYYYKNHTYIYVKRKINWKKASRLSKNIGGYLLVINDFMENMKIRSILKSSIWLGLTDEKKEGKFEWVNGDKLTFTDWNEHEPNNSGNGKNYVVCWIKFDYKWDDQLAEYEYDFICEFYKILPLSKLLSSKKYLYTSK